METETDYKQKEDEKKRSSSPGDCITISSSSSSSSSSDSTPFAFDFSYLLTREDSTIEEQEKESVGPKRLPRVPRSFVLMSHSSIGDEDVVSTTTMPMELLLEAAAVAEEAPETALQIGPETESNQPAAPMSGTTTNGTSSMNSSFLGALARELHDSNLTLNITEDEEAMIRSSTCNTKRYESSKKRHEERFFNTIQDFGSTTLKELLTDITHDNDGIPTTEKRFYYELRGTKNTAKHVILNKCLLLCAFKWRKTSPKAEVGQMLQPTTMDQYLKELFDLFHQKGIQYGYKTDFNGDGEYHSVQKALWNQEIVKDSSYGTGKKTSTFDWEGDAKIEIAYLDPKHPFNPWDTSDSSAGYDSRMWYLVFICGRYFLLRGEKEIAELNVDQFSWHKFTTGENAGKNYVQLNVPWDKTNRLSLKNTNVRALQKNYSPPILIENPDDPLCQYTFVTFMFSLFEPGQKRVFCYPTSKEQKKAFQAAGLPYLYNKNQPIGHNKIGNSQKEFAKSCGFENAEDCTNHGNRKYGITKAVTNADRSLAIVIQAQARHTSVVSHVRYHKTNDQMQVAYQRALTGKDLRPLPSKTPQPLPSETPQARPQVEKRAPPPSEEDERKNSSKSLKKTTSFEFNERNEDDENINPSNLLTTYQPEAPFHPCASASSAINAERGLLSTQNNYYHQMNNHRNVFVDKNLRNDFIEESSLIKKVEVLKEEKEKALNEITYSKKKRKKYESALLETEKKLEEERSKNRALQDKNEASTAEISELKQDTRAQKHSAKTAKQLQESVIAMQKQITDMQRRHDSSSCAVS